MNRRGFLTTVGAAGVGVAAGTELRRDHVAHAADPLPGGLLDKLPFHGPRQAGVVTPQPAQATFLALDAVVPDRSSLASALQALSFKAAALTNGGKVGGSSNEQPPVDSGMLGPVIAPDSLTATIGFGATVFDRFGLDRPAGLTKMPSFEGDRLDPSRCGGDVIVALCANQRDTVVHAVREIMRAVHGQFELRWTIDGFRGAARGPTPKSSPRNLFGFRDGTANPDVNDASLMNRVVWRPDNSTFMVVRTIRMHVEFWDRVGRREQENMIGRDRDSGAPLGGTDEFQDARLDLDPKGTRIPLDSHLRLARGTNAPKLLRRPYNYHRGFDEAGALDQGLAFVAFNRDIDSQFAATQNRLAGEPMTDYITPVGGGYYLVPPGSRAGWVGDGLFT